MIQIRGGRGYETAESLQRARREAGAGRAAAARHAHQPDLRGLHRDHAPAHRPRGGRPAPAGGRRASSTRRRAVADKLRDAVKAGGFYASWFPKLAVGEGQKPGAFAEFGPLAGARPLRRARRRASSPARPSTSWAATRPSSSTRAHLLGRIVDIGAELYAIACACVYAQTIAREDAGAPRRAPFELADLFAQQARRRADGAVPRAVVQRRRRAVQRRRRRCWTAATRGSRRTCSTRPGDGPMLPEHPAPADGARPRAPRCRRGAGRGGAVARAPDVAGRARADLP